MRLDKWLYYTRFVKSRGLAQRLVEEGFVRINAQKSASGAASVKLGDVLTLSLPRRIVVVRVRAFPERRGPTSEAQEMYEILEESLKKAL